MQLYHLHSFSEFYHDNDTKIFTDIYFAIRKCNFPPAAFRYKLINTYGYYVATNNQVLVRKQKFWVRIFTRDCIRFVILICLNYLLITTFLFRSFSSLPEFYAVFVTVILAFWFIYLNCSFLINLRHNDATIYFGIKK